MKKTSLNRKKILVIIKIVHTLIWAIMAGATLYIFYAGVTGIRNMILYISITLLVGETFVLLINKWTCPLTPLAQKYTHDRTDNFDIYLPRWLAKYNKIIFGVIFIIGLLCVVFN